MFDPVRLNTNLRTVAVEAVVAARRALGWSQRDLAERARVSQSLVSRFERGAAGTISLQTTSRLFEALGIRADLRAELPVLTGHRGQADAVHAWCCGYAGRRLSGWSWDVRLEVEVGSGRFRGWIDALAYRPIDRSLLTTEIKTDLPDIGALQRTTSWYEREAWTAARRLGWRPIRQVVAVLVLDSAEAEARIRSNRDIMAAAFPGRAAELEAWIADPGSATPPRSLALIDPAWRGRHWLRPSRVDGRRSPSRYGGYRDAVERIDRSGGRSRPSHA